MDANERIRDIMIVADGLVTLLIKENGFLKNREYDDVRGLVEQKTVLAKGLEAQYKVFEKEPNALKDADEDLREDLRDMAEKIDRLTKENGRLLQIAIKSGEMLMEAVTTAVKQSQPNAGTYAASGLINQGSKDTGKRSSLSLDESL
ncbi:MAG: flagellar protein FlgN [Alphaproteobacteria bacterium]|nr:flagellar protein FlgN [Rhodospirillales bacterium]MCW9045825.1 flagellar protein FlgN [Alphaproteobacteria bacterium]